MSSLQISLLGPIQFQLDGSRIISLSSKKAQALLAFLSVEGGHAHLRDKLAGFLWPDQSVLLARQSLRQALLKLRQALPAGSLSVTQQTIRFELGGDPQSAFVLDVAA